MTLREFLPCDVDALELAVWRLRVSIGAYGRHHAVPEAPSSWQRGKEAWTRFWRQEIGSPYLHNGPKYPRLLVFYNIVVVALLVLVGLYAYAYAEAGERRVGEEHTALGRAFELPVRVAEYLGALLTAALRGRDTAYDFNHPEQYTGFGSNKRAPHFTQDGCSSPWEQEPGQTLRFTRAVETDLLARWLEQNRDLPEYTAARRAAAQARAKEAFRRGRLPLSRAPKVLAVSYRASDTEHEFRSRSVHELHEQLRAAGWDAYLIQGAGGDHYAVSEKGPSRMDGLVSAGTATYQPLHPHTNDDQVHGGFNPELLPPMKRHRTPGEHYPSQRRGSKSASQHKVWAYESALRLMHEDQLVVLMPRNSPTVALSTPSVFLDRYHQVLRKYARLYQQSHVQPGWLSRFLGNVGVPKGSKEAAGAGGGGRRDGAQPELARLLRGARAAQSAPSGPDHSAALTVTDTLLVALAEQNMSAVADAHPEFFTEEGAVLEEDAVEDKVLDEVGRALIFAGVAAGEGPYTPYEWAIPPGRIFAVGKDGRVERNNSGLPHNAWEDHDLFTAKAARECTHRQIVQDVDTNRKEAEAEGSCLHLWRAEALRLAEPYLEATTEAGRQLGFVHMSPGLVVGRAGPLASMFAELRPRQGEDLELLLKEYRLANPAHIALDYNMDLFGVTTGNPQRNIYQWADRCSFIVNTDGQAVHKVAAWKDLGSPLFVEVLSQHGYMEKNETECFEELFQAWRKYGTCREKWVKPNKRRYIVNNAWYNGRE